MIEGSGAGSGSLPLTYRSESIMPKTHTDPTDPDPDPQSCFSQHIIKEDDGPLKTDEKILIFCLDTTCGGEMGE